MQPRPGTEPTCLKLSIHDTYSSVQTAVLEKKKTAAAVVCRWYYRQTEKQMPVSQACETNNSLTSCKSREPAPFWNVAGCLVRQKSGR